MNTDESVEIMIEMDWYDCPFGCDDDVLDRKMYSDPNTYYCRTCGYKFVIKRKKITR